MKSLEEMYTPEEVSDFIDEHICDTCPGMRERVERGEYTECQLKSDIKLAATVNAVARMRKLQEEIRTGLRGKSGDLNVRA